MDKIEVGQEREFINRADLDGKVIDKGTRVRVGFVEDDGLEQTVTVVVLGRAPAESLTMPRHVLMLHSVSVPKPA
jgi:hypothetical protein